MRAAAIFGEIDRVGILGVAFGAAGTALAVLIAVRLGATGLLLPLSLFLLAGLIAAFVRWSHVAVAGTIVYFTLIPTLNSLVTPLVGATKDLIAFAAFTAACILFVQRRTGRQGWPVDKPLLALIALYVGLYVVNIGGGITGESGHGAAWFHGVRLACEPLALIVVGLSLRDTERTQRWALGAIMATGVAVAVVGLAQQALGVGRLLELGFTYGAEVRQIGDRLRSFGTFDEPFSYAEFLLLTLAALLLWARMRVSIALATALVALGLAASFVRTAGLISLALLGIAIAQRGHVRFALLTIAAAVVVLAAVFVDASTRPDTRSVLVSPSQYVTLNGRTAIWQSRLGDSPDAWLFGRGVGAVGTAAERAARSLVGREQINARDGGDTLVDSGYFSVLADVGAVGLAVLLALLGRLGMLAVRATRRGDRAGWFALAAITVLGLDALTRESLTAFPVPWIAFLALGIAASRWSARVEPATHRHPVFAPA